jgi:hypothetical protein
MCISYSNLNVIFAKVVAVCRSSFLVGYPCLAGDLRHSILNTLGCARYFIHGDVWHMTQDLVFRGHLHHDKQIS